MLQACSPRNGYYFMSDKKKLVMREKRIISGNIMEIEVYPVFEAPRSTTRKRKARLTPPKQQNLNDKNARKHLARLINTNFSEADIHLTLTYADAHLPETQERAERDVRNFIRRINTRRKKKGLKPLRYISIIEGIGADGRSGRPHHHIICDGDMPRDEVDAVWRKGRCNSSRLQPDEHGLTALARYISKEKKAGKRWHQSKGLKQPVIAINDNRWSKRRSQQFADHFAERDFEKLFPDWVCSGYQVAFSDVLGLYSLSVMMRRIGQPSRKRKSA